MFIFFGFFFFFITCLYFFFFFNDTATTEIYTLSLHDALPISEPLPGWTPPTGPTPSKARRSEEHTSELQSRRDLVCRLLLEKKKKNANSYFYQKKKKNKQKKKKKIKIN